MIHRPVIKSRLSIEAEVLVEEEEIEELYTTVVFLGFPMTGAPALYALVRICQVCRTRAYSAGAPDLPSVPGAGRLVLHELEDLLRHAWTQH